MSFFERIIKSLKNYVLSNLISSVLFFSLMISGSLLCIYVKKTHINFNLSLDVFYPYLFGVTFNVAAFTLLLVVSISISGASFRYIFNNYYCRYYPDENGDDLIRRYCKGFVLPTFVLNTMFLLLIAYAGGYWWFVALVFAFVYGCIYLGIKESSSFMDNKLEKLFFVFIFVSVNWFMLLLISAYYFLPMQGKSEGFYENIVQIFFGSFLFSVICFCIGISNHKSFFKKHLLYVFLMTIIFVVTIKSSFSRIVVPAVNSASFLPKTDCAEILLNPKAVEKINLITGRSLSSQNGLMVFKLGASDKILSTVGGVNIQMKTIANDYATFNLSNEEAQVVIVSSNKMEL